MHCHRYSGVRASTARIPSSPVFHRPIDSPCPTSRYINWSHWQKHGIADIDVWVSIERWLCIDQCTANCADMVIGYSNHMTRASGCVWGHVNALGHASRAGGIRLALAEILRENTSNYQSQVMIHGQAWRNPTMTLTRRHFKH